MKINAVVVSVPHEYVYRVRNIHKTCFGGDAEARLVEALARTGDYIDELSLAGVVDGRYVAHVLMTAVRIAGTEKVLPGLALAPVATLPRFRGLGIASHLIEYAIEKAKKTRNEFIIVVGDPRFYSRFGFGPASRYNIRALFKVNDENFMALKIGNSRSFSGGDVEYPAAFVNV